MSKVDLYEKFLEVDATLATGGVPAASRFWKTEAKRFLRSGKRRWIVRKGRRAGGTLNMAKLAVVVALYGDWQVPPGEVGMIPWLSVERREAMARLRQIAAFLDILGEAYDKVDEEIRLRARPAIFRVTTASIAAVSGFTTISAFCDEVAKWRDETSGANPASEVLASLTPTMSTIPTAFVALLSSPWSETDFHSTLFDQGETTEQCVSFCESWVGNPSLTRESTRALASSEIEWLREYAAMPSASSASLIGAVEYDSLVRRKGVPRLPPIPDARHLIGLDVGLRNDRTAVVVVRKEYRTLPDGGVREVSVVVAIEHLVPGLLRRISIEDVVAAVARLAKEYPGIVVADQHYIDSVAPKVRALGLQIDEVAMSPSAIADRVAALQTKLSEQSIEFIDHPELRKEILGAVVVHHQGGRITCKVPERKGHDDLLSALLNTNDPEHYQRLFPCEGGDIIVQRGCVHFEHLTGLEVQPDRYFRRAANGGLVPTEPPFASAAFIRWAQSVVARGGMTESIRRWCGQIGVPIRPTMNASELDPASGNVQPWERPPPVVTALPEADPIAQRMNAHRGGRSRL